MTVVDIEVQTSERSNLPLFAKLTAESIREGYGAGNCTPQSVAFWTLYNNGAPHPGTFTCRITLDSPDLSRDEIATAVNKVTSDPSGNIKVFGHTIGRWETIESRPADRA